MRDQVFATGEVASIPLQHLARQKAEFGRLTVIFLRSECAASAVWTYPGFVDS